MPFAASRSVRALDRIQVGLVVLTRPRLDRLPHHPEPYGVEPLTADVLGILGVEAGRLGGVRLHLVDDVPAGHHRRASLVVDDPPASAPVGPLGGIGDGGQHREHQGGEREGSCDGDPRHAAADDGTDIPPLPLRPRGS